MRSSSDGVCSKLLTVTNAARAREASASMEAPAAFGYAYAAIA
jgi:hypothetical protein